MCIQTITFKIFCHLFTYEGPPNITTSFETNIKDRSVKLIGNVFIYDGSPEILDTFWEKKSKEIKMEENSWKLLEGNNPTRIINNVIPDDAGEYQLTATNAVGTSTSDVIVIGISVIIIKPFLYNVLCHVERCCKFN